MTEKHTVCAYACIECGDRHSVENMAPTCAMCVYKLRSGLSRLRRAAEAANIYIDWIEYSGVVKPVGGHYCLRPEKPCRFCERVQHWASVKEDARMRAGVDLHNAWSALASLSPEKAEKVEEPGEGRLYHRAYQSIGSESWKPCACKHGFDHVAATDESIVPPAPKTKGCAICGGHGFVFTRSNKTQISVPCLACQEAE